MHDTKVLSLDFDYFQNVSPQTIQSVYPEGIDLGSDLSIVVWASKYAFPDTGGKLLKVKPLYRELRLLGELLLRQSPLTKVMVANSHLEAYNFIHQNIDVGSEFALHNVDMHHDILNNNDELDCGNWIGHIFEDYGRKNIDFKWVVNPVSLDMYGFDLDEKSKMDLCVESSVAALQQYNYDMIFLCRSDSWLPPHLDTYFDALLELIKSHFDVITIDTQVTKPRNYAEAVDIIRGSRNNDPASTGGGECH